MSGSISSASSISSSALRKLASTNIKDRECCLDICCERICGYALFEYMHSLHLVILLYIKSCKIGISFYHCRINFNTLEEAFFRLLPFGQAKVVCCLCCSIHQECPLLSLPHADTAIMPLLVSLLVAQVVLYPTQ